MSNIVLTRDQFEELVYDVTATILTGANIRRSWQKDGAPAFSVDDNVVFFKIVEVHSEMSKQRDSFYSQTVSPASSNMEKGSTRTVSVEWTFYGDNAWDNATALKNGLYDQENHDTLAKSNVYMVPDFPPPRRAPELFEGMWYERWDLAVPFNELVVFNKEVAYLKAVEIEVEDRSGVRAVIDITD